MAGSPDAAPPGLPLVTVIDDERTVRESLTELLEALGFFVDAFASAEAFLASDAPARTECLLLDVNLGGMSGLELMRELPARGYDIPVVFITAQHEAYAQLLASGASDCLIKPSSDEKLESALRKALSLRAG